MLRQINLQFCRALTPYCEKCNIKVAAENTWQRDPNRRYMMHSTCAALREMNAYMDRLDSKGFVSCIDIGRCTLVGGDIGDMIRAIGPRLHALHVHDVDYFRDDHALPGMKKLDFDAVAQTLAEVHDGGELTLEAGKAEAYRAAQAFHFILCVSVRLDWLCGAFFDSEAE